VFQEIAVGEITARNESEETIRSDLGWLDLRPFTTRCAYHAAVIEADLRGRNAYDPTIKSDVLIGRVARPPSVPVVTRSTDDLWLFPHSCRSGAVPRTAENAALMAVRSLARI
jgi:predicted nucleic acid-binding protein